MCKPLWLIGLILSGACFTAWADPAPEEARHTTWQPTAAALHAVEALDVQRLVDDTYFVEALKRLVTDADLSADDKADVLALMLHSVGWRFNGVVPVPPHAGYVDVYAKRAGTFVHYQVAVSPLNVDIAGMVDVVKRTHASDSIRSGHALLLAAMLDPAAAAPVVSDLLDEGRLSRAQVPPIALHLASFAVVLIRDDALTQRIAALASRVPLEESREDILCAAGYWPLSPPVRNLMLEFVRSSAQDAFDNATWTGLAVLHNRVEPDVYQTLLDDLFAETTDETERATLGMFPDDVPIPARGGLGELPGTLPGESRWIFKQWDGFTVTLYDEGARIQWGQSFSDYLAY